MMMSSVVMNDDTDELMKVMVTIICCNCLYYTWLWKVLLDYNAWIS